MINNIKRNERYKTMKKVVNKNGYDLTLEKVKYKGEFSKRMISVYLEVGTRPENTEAFLILKISEETLKLNKYGLDSYVEKNLNLKELDYYLTTKADEDDE